MKLFGITLALASAQGTEEGRHYFPEPIPTDDYNATKTPYWPTRAPPPMDHCFKCEAKNFALCFLQHYQRYLTHKPLMCPMGKVCSMTERRRGGKVEWVSMQCKDYEVCEEEKIHNIRPCPQMPSATECNQMQYGRTFEN